MNEEKIGTIVHYWPKAGAAQVELDHGIVQVGDRIRIRGKDHVFEQEILSLEIDHVSKSEGYPGEFVAIAVDEPVREKDEVWVVRARRATPRWAKP
jgi:translation elongation factor EF-1alpha